MSETDRRPWRVGGHWGVTIVAEGEGDPDEGGRRPSDRLVGMARSEERAQQICDEHNRITLRDSSPDASDDQPEPASELTVTLRSDGTVAVWQREGRSAADLAAILRGIADGFENHPQRLA